MSRILVVGGGIFGAASALELRQRGHEVALLDPSPLSHPLAESTDISKIVRLDYGPDEALLEWMERALLRWRRWGAEAPLFHECGVLFLCEGPLREGSFEAQSLTLLERRGHPVERLGPEDLARRYPGWPPGWQGYLNPQGGWAASGAAVDWLRQRAAAEGVALRQAQVSRLLWQGGRVVGLLDEAGQEHRADEIVVAAGAWTQLLVPELSGLLRAVGQPVFHLRPADPQRYAAPAFPVFTADIARTGWYGFPLHPSGLLKVANHGPGRALHPADDAREVLEAEELLLRAWLQRVRPELLSAPIVHRRLCVYGDSLDGDFWIDRHCEGLVVAAGGSGHGFKFGPVLGELIADVVEDRPHPLAPRFARRGHRPGWVEAARATA